MLQGGNNKAYLTGMPGMFVVKLLPNSRTQSGSFKGPRNGSVKLELAAGVELVENSTCRGAPRDGDGKR